MNCSIQVILYSHWNSIRHLDYYLMLTIVYNRLNECDAFLWPIHQRIPMPHAKFKNRQCRPVVFKTLKCHPIEFKTMSCPMTVPF